MRSRSACAGSFVSVSTRAERLRQRRQRLHRPDHDERVAGRHAALDAAGAVRLAVVAALVRPEDLVVGLRSPRAPPARSRRRSPTPFSAWIDMIACASRPSRRSSHEMCEPMPGTSPKAITSNSPPSDSLAFRAASISATIASLASASSERTGDSSTPSKSAGGERARAPGAVDGPDPRHVRADLHAERAQERLREPAGGDPRRGLARGGALEHVAHVRVAELLDPGQVGVARPREVDLLHRPRPPARGSSAPPSSGSRGSRSTSPPGCRASARGERPAVTVARSFSIFMRPPRPWPSWRRARSASMSSGRSSRPAGSPSTIAVSPGPWDSPAVTNRKDMTPTPYKRGCGRQVGGGTAGRGLLIRRGCTAGSCATPSSGAHGLNALMA